MKKLIIICIIFVLYSCNDTPTRIENPKKETTVELQQLAKLDSLTYKVIEKENKVYVISTKTNLLVKKISNQSGEANTLALLFVGILVIMWIILIIILIMPRD